MTMKACCDEWEKLIKELIMNEEVHGIANDSVNETDWLECDDCGKRKKDVEETTCPYEEEINNKIIECKLCCDCYNERSMDI